MAHYESKRAFDPFDRKREAKEVCYQIMALLLIQLMLPVLVLMDAAIRLGKWLSQ